jgi:hypothetical protein
VHRPLGKVHTRSRAGRHATGGPTSPAPQRLVLSPSPGRGARSRSPSLPLAPPVCPTTRSSRRHVGERGRLSWPIRKLPGPTASSSPLRPVRWAGWAGRLWRRPAARLWRVLPGPGAAAPFLSPVSGPFSAASPSLPARDGGRRGTRTPVLERHNRSYRKSLPRPVRFDGKLEAMTPSTSRRSPLTRSSHAAGRAVKHRWASGGWSARRNSTR